MSLAEPEISDHLPTPEQVAHLVRSLALVMDERAVSELDLSLGQLTLRLRRPPHPVGQAHSQPAPASPLAPAEPDEAHLITAPMVGTFYTAPTPSAPPFVKPGDRVAAGQTIGIIEAMKIMNEITADRSGVILEFLVGNGQPVEYGSPLLRLAPDSAHP